MFKSDFGGEYISLIPYLKEQGSMFRNSCPHTH